MINPATNPATAAAVAQAAQNNTPAAASSVLSSDFETFLKMLTAQARYQDPLEPLDSSEYAAQLAQFSMVEQQVMSNDLLTALTAQLGSGNMAQMAGWIGMEARTTAPVQFDGSPITIHHNPPAVADKAFLVVRDAEGTEVQRREIPVSAEPVEWAGVTQSGAPFANGVYSFTIESFANDEFLVADPGETYGRVTEARTQGTETVLILEGGSLVKATNVTGLREPVAG